MTDLWVDTEPTIDYPDNDRCRWCNRDMVFIDYCYVHVKSGWADCPDMKRRGGPHVPPSPKRAYAHPRLHAR